MLGLKTTLRVALVRLERIVVACPAPGHTSLSSSRPSIDAWRSSAARCNWARRQTRVDSIVGPAHQLANQPEPLKKLTHVPRAVRTLLPGGAGLASRESLS